MGLAGASGLDAVLATAELARRPARQPDYAAENAALIALARAMAEAPEALLQKLVDTALTLCGAGSAGISLIEALDGAPVFRWHAAAGALAGHLGTTMRRDSSPCGAVLDRKTPQLMIDPVRHYATIAALCAPVAELLLIPFFRGDTAVGAIWVVSHGEAKKFDAEDARIVTSLTQFAAAAVQHRQARDAAEAANREVHDIRSRIEAALAAGTIGTWSWDIQRDRVFADASFSKSFGLSPEDGARGVPLARFIQAIHPDDRDRVGARIGQTIEAGDGYATDFRIVKPDGDVQWVSARGLVERDAEGRATRLPGVLVDITSRKDVEDELKDRDERLKLLISCATDFAVIITDTAGRIIEWKGGAEPIFGWREEEVLARSAALFFTPEDVARGIPEKEMATAIREGRAEDKRWHVKKDGSRFFGDGVLVPLRGRAGELRGFGKVLRDETARKRAEEEMARRFEAEKHQSDLLRQVASTSRSINASLSVESIARVLTEDARDIIGAHEARLSATLEDDALPFHSVAISSEHSEHRHGAEPARGMLEAPLLDHSGKNLGLLRLSDKCEGEFDENDSIVLAQLSAVASVAIQNARFYEKLQEQDARKNEFLATLAHELRNPLAPIRTGLEVIKLSQPAGANLRALTMMERQLGHMVRLVDDLLDIARVSRGKVELKKERVTLRSLVEGAVETSRPLMEAARHELVVKLPEQPLLLDVDRTRMSQVLSNLLNNAAKYTPNGGRVEVSAERRGRLAVIRIADNGVGIPKEMLPKVFDIFTQVGRSLERAQGGLGIGLSLVKRLVEMHDGSVEARSDGPGHGCVFTVSLQIAAEGAEAAHPGGAEGRSPVAERLKVLVVDDNMDSAESLAMLLDLDGHETRCAYSGPEALEVAREHKPNLVFLDIGLPGMNGYEVAEELRRSPALDRPVLVALTGWGSEEDRRRSMEAGFDHHMTKPVEPTQVAALLSRVTRFFSGVRGD